MTVNYPIPDFKVTLIFDAECLIDYTRFRPKINRPKNDICSTHQCKISYD